MSSARYSVRIGEACCICSDMPYETLLLRVMEFTVRAAIAKSADQSLWEHEQLRKHGLGALVVFCTAPDSVRAQNELDPRFYAKFDRDLRARWSRLGYYTETLRGDMKALFSELEHDAAEAAADARGRLLADFFSALQEMH